MNTADWIIGIMAVSSFIPFLLVIITGSVYLMNEMIHDIKNNNNRF